MPSILLVDDEPNITEIMEIILTEEGMDVATTSSGSEALARLRDQTFDLVISDIRMPDISGVDLLKEAQKLAPDTAFIMMTAYASTETAIEALQHGAHDYITKPFKMDELRQIVRRVLEKKADRQDPGIPQAEIDSQLGQKLFQALHRSQMIGKSPEMLEVYRTIGTVAPTLSTILITGESGTGKGLVARAIHEASKRREMPFVAINCGAFPETLLESELFGYMKGAFTGATGNKKGLFEVAEEGTIFLDEVTEMTQAMQVKLLKVLQERLVRPLGSSAETPINVRVIAATNRDLQTAIRQGLFREDLYYRIAVITIHIPALRERSSDIELLAQHFLRSFCQRTGKKILSFSPATMGRLIHYPWPGNVRELENTIERAVALEETDQIQVDRLPDSIRAYSKTPLSPPHILPDEPFDLEAYLADIERSIIRQALARAEGNQTLAAQHLRLTKPSLRHRIHVLGIDPAGFRRNSSEHQS
jgi:two-component system, NtrC family, response regulator PilR